MKSPYVLRSLSKNNNLMMRLLKQLSVLFIIYLLLGGLLLLIEPKVLADLDMLSCAVQIFYIGIVFWVYTLIELYVIANVRKNQPKVLPGLLIGFKGGRLLLSFFAIILFGILEGNSVVVFSINLVLFYIVTMFYNSILLLREENKSELKG